MEQPLVAVRINQPLSLCVHLQDGVHGTLAHACARCELSLGACLKQA
jgi:hypothetical protein